MTTLDSGFRYALRQSDLRYTVTADVAAVDLRGGDRMHVRQDGQSLVLELNPYGADERVFVATVSVRCPEAAVWILERWS